MSTDIFKNEPEVVIAYLNNLSLNEKYNLGGDIRDRTADYTEEYHKKLIDVIGYDPQRTDIERNGEDAFYISGGEVHYDDVFFQKTQWGWYKKR